MKTWKRLVLQFGIKSQCPVDMHNGRVHLLNGPHVLNSTTPYSLITFDTSLQLRFLCNNFEVWSSKLWQHAKTLTLEAKEVNAPKHMFIPAKRKLADIFPEVWCFWVSSWLMNCLKPCLDLNLLCLKARHTPIGWSWSFRRSGNCSDAIRFGFNQVQYTSKT